MKHDSRSPDPHDIPDAREWSAQERALAEERAGLGLEAGDAPLRSYRLVARLLAQPPAERLPADFAWRTAQLAERAGVNPRLADTRLERNLLALLAAALAVSGLAAVALYGANWMPTFDHGPAGQLLSQPWLWPLLACMGLSGLFERRWLRRELPRHVRPGGLG
jgi:hypothetical protein